MPGCQRRCRRTKAIWPDPSHIVPRPLSRYVAVPSETRYSAAGQPCFELNATVAVSVKIGDYLVSA